MSENREPSEGPFRLSPWKLILENLKGDTQIYFLKSHLNCAMTHIYDVYESKKEMFSSRLSPKQGQIKQTVRDRRGHAPFHRTPKGTISQKYLNCAANHIILCF